MLKPTGRSMVMYDFDTDSSTAGCLDMSGEAFTEPFMIDTIERRLRERPRPFALAGEWQEVCDVLQDQPSLSLRGMIFHTGRCGSTLMANAFSAMPQAMTLKESPFLSATAAKAMSADSDLTMTHELLQALQRNCLPPTNAEQRYQIWKFASWNILADPVWSAAFPDSARVFMWRPCAEVMASEIAAPPLWANGKGRVNHSMFSSGRALMREAGLTDLPTAQALSLAAWLSTAAKGIELGERGDLVLAYDTVRSDLAGSMRAVTAHFGVPVTAEEAERAAQVRHFYSKDPSGKKKFQETTPSISLDRETTRRIDDLTGDLEERLSKLSHTTN
ncbi:hypothetical protein OG426_28980 [Streptomyces canus]|uniref:hypothetical protein n=1 Tax=Streptomyces canus TaxID=58343 RepID=UPI00386B6CE3|nr:hypothetical protein OG426_28980 [Streptomyces canus]